MEEILNGLIFLWVEKIWSELKLEESKKINLIECNWAFNRPLAVKWQTPLKINIQ